ncbi:MAG: radical SAM protein [Candidatus Parcubacteria bacterium]|nr:radical SAM protein [Candidatus Parcubacteria bacterium]
MSKLPRDLVLAVTYNCNSKCRMCNIWKSEPLPVLALSEYEKLPASFKDINISGGEPFLRPDLVDLIKLLVAKNPQARIVISSNGFATELIKAKMQEILKIKPEIGIGISVDGIGEIHDQIRGIPGGFQKVLATIKELKALGVKNIRLAYTAGDYNIDQLYKVYQLSQELGTEFTLAAIHNAENYFNTTDNKITKLEEFRQEFGLLIKEELNTWNVKRWLRAYFAYALYKFLATGKRLLPNYSGQDNIFIDPLGNVYPADVSGHIMGNLKEFNNFSDLYYSKVSQEAISLEKINQNWMMCTARYAMERHAPRVIGWIIKAKIFGVNL